MFILSQDPIPVVSIHMSNRAGLTKVVVFFINLLGVIAMNQLTLVDIPISWELDSGCSHVVWWRESWSRDMEKSKPWITFARLGVSFVEDVVTKLIYNDFLVPGLGMQYLWMPVSGCRMSDTGARIPESNYTKS